MRELRQASQRLSFGSHSIRVRTWYATALAVVAMLVVGGSMLVTINVLSQQNDRLHNGVFSVGLLLRDMQHDVRIVEKQINSLASDPSPLVIRRFQRDMARLNSAMTTRLGDIADGFSGNPSLVVDLQQSLKQSGIVLDQILRAIDDNDAVATYTLIKTEGAGYVAELDRRLEALLSATNDEASALRVEHESMIRLALWEHVLIFALAVLVAGGGAVFVNRAIVNPTNEISVAIREIARGRLGTMIPHTGRSDEIGEIAKATQVFLERAIAVRNASFDLLTELPTRDQFKDHINALRIDPDNNQKCASLIAIDIDGFSEINDSHGRRTGDLVLKHIADLLRSCSRLGDFVARDDADSFIFMVLGREVDDVLQGIALPLSSAIAEPIEIDGELLTVSCSIGVAPYDRHTPPEELLGHAEKALKEAGVNGEGGVAVYTDEMDERLQRRRRILADLKFALAHDEIAPFFQPQIETGSGRLVGFEALVRWNHPEHGVLSPWQFLGLAQEAGLMGAITETMISKSLDHFTSWQKMGLNPGRVSLNFTAEDLRRLDFVDRLSLEVERVGLEPDQVCVELLESAMIEDEDDPISKTLKRLVALGFPIELDDFGTGHSAVATLQLCEFTGVKLDRSFVTELHNRPEQRKVVRAMLSMARAMGASCVAEGVESDSERAVLAQMGCEAIQGFGIALPMTASDTTHWLENYKPKQCDGPDVASPVAV